MMRHTKPSMMDNPIANVILWAYPNPPFDKLYRGVFLIVITGEFATHFQLEKVLSLNPHIF